MIWLRPVGRIGWRKQVSGRRRRLVVFHRQMLWFFVNGRYNLLLRYHMGNWDRFGWALAAAVDNPADAARQHGEKPGPKRERRHQRGQVQELIGQLCPAGCRGVASGDGVDGHQAYASTKARRGQRGVQHIHRDRMIAACAYGGLDTGDMD